jgi:DNA-binding MarR family transcriptional regulator
MKHMNPTRSTRRHFRALRPSASDGSALLLGRAYLNYQTVLQSAIEEEGLENYFRPGQGSVLFTLYEEDGILMSDLAARTSLAASSVTQIVGQMETARLVKRTRDPEDGRAVRVHLTRLARRLEPRCRKLNQRMRGLLEAGMSEAEVSELRRLLGILVGNLHDYFTPSST